MIRLAKKNDVNMIKTIENRCFSSPWTENMILESMENGCIMLVAEEGKNIVGYGGLYPSGDITNVAVLPEYRGKGYGKLIVQSLLASAKEHNIECVYLEVRVSNQIAIKLYEKCGFKLINTRKRYYPGGEDALIYAFGGV